SAESRLALARVTLEEGKAGEAATAAHAAALLFRAQGAAETEALAASVEARALVASGKLSEARAVVDSARKLVEKSANPGLRLAVVLAGVRLLVAADEREEARLRVVDALGEANRAGLAAEALEARLLLATLDPGREGAALAEVEAAAKAKGYGLVAREA